MTTYHVDGFQPIRQSEHPSGEVQTVTDAARIFANRLARRTYGKRGYCYTVRADSWATDNSSHTFEAFIGRDVPNSGCEGHNEWLYVAVRQ
jgi:hypothetical protein